MTRRSALTVVAAGALLCPATAWAGNDEAVLFGSEATLTAGAVTATTAEGSALWYNPAGIASVPNNRLDVSGSAFMLRLYSVPDFLSATSGGGVTASISEIVSVPAASTFVRRISARVQLAAGIFVPAQSDYTLRASFTSPDMSRWIFTQTQVASDTHVGVGVGVEVLPTLRVGASLFGAYKAASGTDQFLGGIAVGNGMDTFTSYSSLHSFRAVGLEAGLGVQWSPLPELRVGASLRSPTVQVYNDATITEISTIASRTAMGPVSAFEPAEVSESEFAVRVVTPMRVRVGVAWVGPRASAAIDADISPGFTPDGDDPRDLNWNLRVGGRYRLREQLAIGAGFFTDRSPYRAAEVSRERRLDFYGATVGVEFGNSHEIVHGPAARLSFATTLGLRYAYGVGEIDTAVVDAQNEFQTRQGRITVHEIGLNLGSTLRF